MDAIAPYDHHDAIDHAETLTDSPAIRNYFLRSGTITPGVYATVTLHAVHRSDLDELLAYLDARIAADDRGPVTDWPG